MNIPNCVSPIVAYRVWRWTHSGLTSLNGELWPPNQSLQAKCSEFPNGHASPHGNCSCGIYAAKSLDQLLMRGYADAEVFGEVYLWGTVVEHEFGWRAQFAYPKTLVVPESLSFGRFVQRELSTAELEVLKNYAAYGADVFLAGEKESFPLWTRMSPSEAKQKAEVMVSHMRRVNAERRKWEEESKEMQRRFEAEVDAERLERERQGLKLICPICGRDDGRHYANCKVLHLMRTGGLLARRTKEDAEVVDRFLEARRHQRGELCVVCPFCGTENNYHLANCEVLRHSWLVWQIRVGPCWRFASDRHIGWLRLKVFWQQLFA
jgi:hypothetical protein